METSGFTIDLKGLGRQLQAALQRHLPEMPIQVQCAMKGQALMVLAQHLPGIVPDPLQTFKTLEQAINEAAQVTQPVRLYLRIVGQQQPYAFHTFTLELINPFISEPVEPPTEPQNIPIAVLELPSSVEAHHSSVDDLAATDRSIDLSLDPPIDLSLDPPEATKSGAANYWGVSYDSDPTTIPDEDIELIGYGSPEVTLPLPTSFNSDSFSPESAQSSPAPSPRHMGPALKVGGTIAAIFVSIGAIYALSRPCVVGTCSLIPAADRASQEALQAVQQAKSEPAIAQAQTQLRQATDRLADIPPWSSYHATAQTLLQRYQGQTLALGQVVAAQAQARTAAQKSLVPPHPLQTWVEVQQLWRGAIAQLEQVPATDTTYALAQQKLKEYRANLVNINRRIQSEEQAYRTLTMAKSTAQAAEVRQSNAQNLESWQLAFVTWQTALNTLNQIPQGTMARREAEELRGTYQPQLATARDRKIKEDVAARAYKQVLTLAEQAQKFQKASQWFQAVTVWRSTLNVAQQVPQDTFYYTQTQSLIEGYTTALQQAEEGLRVAGNLQTTQNSLQTTCTGQIQICTYTVEPNSLKVQLTSAYMQTILGTAASARATGDTASQGEVNAALKTLQSALETISQNARIPLELYSHEGALMGRYIPSI